MQNVSKLFLISPELWMEDNSGESPFTTLLNGLFNHLFHSYAMGTPEILYIFTMDFLILWQKQLAEGLFGSGFEGYNPSR